MLKMLCGEIENRVHGKAYVKMLSGLVIPCEISLAHSDMPGKAVIFKKKKLESGYQSESRSAASEILGL